jgi:hypothetical protein
MDVIPKRIENSRHKTLKCCNSSNVASEITEFSNLFGIYAIEDRNKYPTKRKISDAEMEAMNILKNDTLVLQRNKLVLH